LNDRLEAWFHGWGGRHQKVRGIFSPDSEIGTADFADFAEVKPVSFLALASDFEAVFVSQLLFIRASRASRGFNSGLRG
jgi:hypothetical protein